MPETARLAVARKFGGPEVIAIEEVPVEPLPAGAVRVAPRAVGLNPVETRRRSGTFGGRPPLVFGTEFSGVITASRSPRWNVGDEVIGWGASGAAGDLVAVDPDRLVLRPENLSPLVAGGIAAVGQTALTALDRVNVPSGGTIVVHGASGGVGTALVQLAVARGIRVIGTAGERNQDYLRELGATPVVYGDGLAERIAAAAGDAQISASVDLAGTREAGDFAASLIASGGRAITMVPETMSSHGLPLVQVQYSRAGVEELVAAAANGSLRLDTEGIPFTEIVAAHHRLDAGHGRGKIVLDLSDNPYLNQDPAAAASASATTKES